MNQTLAGLRHGALTITYNLLVAARGLSRRLASSTTVGVRILAPYDGQILLVRHRGGRWPWALPGGGVERHEPLPAAALRELREEAGCPAMVAHLHGLFHNFDEGMNDFIATFVCTPLGPARPPPGDLEIVDAHFFPTGDLPANLDPGCRRRIAEYGRGEVSRYGPW